MIPVGKAAAKRTKIALAVEEVRARGFLYFLSNHSPWFASRLKQFATLVDRIGSFDVSGRLVGALPITSNQLWAERRAPMRRILSEHFTKPVSALVTV